MECDLHCERNFHAKIHFNRAYKAWNDWWLVKGKRGNWIPIKWNEMKWNAHKFIQMNWTQCDRNVSINIYIFEHPHMIEYDDVKVTSSDEA